MTVCLDTNALKNANKFRVNTNFNYQLMYLKNITPVSKSLLWKCIYEYVKCKMLIIDCLRNIDKGCHFEVSKGCP